MVPGGLSWFVSRVFDGALSRFVKRWSRLQSRQRLRVSEKGESVVVGSVRGFVVKRRWHP